MPERPDEDQPDDDSSQADQGSDDESLTDPLTRTDVEAPRTPSGP